MFTCVGWSGRQSAAGAAAAERLGGDSHGRQSGQGRCCILDRDITQAQTLIKLPGATFCPSTTGTGKLAGAVATWLAWWKAVWAGLVFRMGAMGSPVAGLYDHVTTHDDHLLTIDHRGGEVGGCGGATEGIVGTGGSREASGEGSLGAGGRETEQSS